jgi:hypothetical protein
MSEAQIKKTPLHLWVIGVVGLLWSAMGAVDYLMTQTRNDGYMAKFTPEQLEHFYGYPTWVIAAWALAVWCGVAGTILLLLRKRLAESVLLVSLIAMVLSTIYNYGMSDGLEIMGGVGPFMFTVAIFLVALGLWLYARAMRVRGVIG